MKIGILGTGDVGQALGTGFAGMGHEVMLGSRTAASERALAWRKRVGARASVGTFADAARFAELAVLATAWSGTENAVRMAGPAELAGKTVLDATNPLIDVPNQPPALALGQTDSGGEQVQRWLRDAHVVKAMNTVSYAHMVHPDFPYGPPDMFICGNDIAAKQQVATLIGELGWPAIDMGGIEGARLIEPMAVLFITYAIRTGSWNYAFKLLSK